MLLIFIVNIVLLLCLTRPALAQSTASLSISLVTPSAYVVGFTTQGTTVQTNELDAFVGLSLPAGTQEVYVVGVMQPNGAQAAYCIDCTIVDEKLVGDFKSFDTSSTDGSTQQAALTGPLSLDPDAAYNLTIINTDPDPNRTLILDSLALTIQTSSTSSSVIPSSTATASLSVQPTTAVQSTTSVQPTTMSTPLSSPSAAPSATESPSAASTGDTSQQRTLAIVLATVLGSIALLALLLSIFCLRRRRLRKTIQPAPSDDTSSTTPVLQQQTVQLSSVSLGAAEAGAIATVRPLPQMPHMREVETPPSANQRVKPLPPVPSPPRSQEPTPPTPQTPPRTPQTPSSGSLYSSSSARLSTRPPSAQPGSFRNSSSPRKSSVNLRRSSTRALRQYPPMPMPTDTTLSQAPKEWQTRVDPVLPRDTASPRHAHSPSVYSLGVFERERIERERVNSGMGDQEGGDVGGGFGFRWSRGTIIYPMTPSVSGEGLPDGWDP